MPRRVEVEYRVYDGPQTLSQAAAEHFLATTQATVRTQGVARVAISGGNTPRPVFELLANPAEKFVAAMPWQQMELYWVVERMVPPDNKDSNYRMTREAMLDKVPLPPDRIFRIEGELNPDEAAARY